MELKVFTLNCWGLFGLSRDRELRIKAIADVLAESQYDIVCLQEVWMDCDFETIKNRTVNVLPYSHYFYSGVVGSGICILSKHVILETFYHQWPVNGYIHKLQHGDWFGGKGVALCKLRVHKYYNINVYSTHLHAEYDRNSDEYQAHRIIQAFDTAQFIKMTANNVDLVLLAGDLNTEPTDLAYQLFTTYIDLIDTYHLVDESVTLFHPPGYTYEVYQNRYTPRISTGDGKRIDYVMFQPTCQRLNVKLKSYTHPLPHRIPKTDCSYSDHEAISTTFILSVNRADRSNTSTTMTDEMKRSVLQDSIGVCEHALKLIVQHRLIYIIFTVAFTLLLGATFICSFTIFAGMLFRIFIACSALCLGFSVIMATVWHKIERHAILAGKLAMMVSLQNLKGK